MAATGQLLTELAEDLAAGGSDVSVVTGRPLTVSDGSIRRGIVSRESRNGVAVVRANGTRFDARRFAGRAANYVSYFASAALASLSIRRPDVVASLTDPPIIGLVALWTARRTGAKFVFICEDIFPEVAALIEDFQSPLVNRWLDRVNRHLLSRADAIVALGPRMRRRLVEEKGACESRVTIVHNWADADAIAPAPKDNAFARAQGLADRFVVMHSGNVGLSQNLDLVIEAADRLRSHANIVFAIVGNGARRPALEAAAEQRGLSNVRFLSYQPKDQLTESFAAADVFLVSLKAGIGGYIVPSKVYGILAAGRPYIAAVAPDCEAAIIARDHACGLVIAPGDPDALAASVLRLSRDGAATAAMGERARAAALLYDRRRAVAAYRDLFARVTGRHAQAHV